MIDSTLAAMARLESAWVGDVTCNGVGRVGWHRLASLACVGALIDT